MKKQVLVIFSILILFLIAMDNSTYSRYVLTRNLATNVSSAPFYFKAQSSTNKINFPRTTDNNDKDNILTTTSTFNLVISNNDGTNYNDYDVNYEISVVGSDKFTLDNNQDTITKTIKGGSLLNETVPVNLVIKDLTKTTNKVVIRVTSTYPYQQSFDFTYTVTQEGAIQYIEDLVDMALGIRGRENPKNLNVNDIQSQRFKMTRDLDFNDPNSYENSSRTDYGDVNGNSTTAENLLQELTSDTGFLPIGELNHPFKGVFNGGNHTLDNLRIHKALQYNIGMFGTIEGATLKNLTIANGNVYNENQTAGMLVGKAIGSVIDHITVSGISVMSVDTVHTSEDTYTGGIAGYVSEGSTVSYCKNYATVTTEFTGDATNYSGPAGGITAWMSTSTITHCDNYGEVTGQRYIGGIAGFSAMQDKLSSTDGYGTVSYCTNHGTVKTYVKTASSTLGYYVGGIVGYNKAHGTIEYNTNYEEAVVTGISGVGGIVGNNAKINNVTGVVRNNTNYSTHISSGANAHGIAGSWSGYSGIVGKDSYGNTNNPRT